MMSIPDPPYELEVTGHFSPGQLRVVWRDEPACPDPRREAMVSATWEQALADAERDGRMLFNGQLTRYLRHHHDDGRLTIEVGPTDYAAFMGTNFLNYARGPEFGWENYSNPIGTTATLITADGWLVYGRRNLRVACHPGYIHTFGGGLEEREKGPDGCFDAFACVRRELDEELRIQPADIAKMTCVALLRDPIIRQPELIFDAYLHSTLADLQGRLRPGDPHEEHEALVALRDEPDAAVPFILTAERIAPVAIGAICEHGRHRYGHAWLDSTLARLKHNS